MAKPFRSLQHIPLGFAGYALRALDAEFTIEYGSEWAAKDVHHRWYRARRTAHLAPKPHGFEKLLQVTCAQEGTKLRFHRGSAPVPEPLNITTKVVWGKTRYILED